MKKHVYDQILIFKTPFRNQHPSSLVTVVILHISLNAFKNSILRSRPEACPGVTEAQGGASAGTPGGHWSRRVCRGHAVSGLVGTQPPAAQLPG